MIDNEEWTEVEPPSSEEGEKVEFEVEKEEEVTPEPEPKVEEKIETFSEAVASGKLDTDTSSLDLSRVKKKAGQSKKV